MILALFIALLVISLAIVAWGFKRKASIIVIVGALMMVFVVVLTEDLTDTVMYVEGSGTPDSYTDVLFYDNPANATVGDNYYTNALAEPFTSVEVNDGSPSWVGKNVTSIVVYIGVDGTGAETGFIDIGIFDESDGSLIESFGEFDISVLSGQDLTDVPVGVMVNGSHVMQAGEAIGFSSGNASNVVDQTTFFSDVDAQGSYIAFYSIDDPEPWDLAGQFYESVLVEGEDDWQEHSTPLDYNFRFLLGMLALALMVGGVIAFRGFSI